MGDSPQTDCACPAPQGLWLPWLLFHATSGPQPLSTAALSLGGEEHGLWNHTVFGLNRDFVICSQRQVGLPLRDSVSLSVKWGWRYVCPGVVLRGRSEDWRASGVLAPFPPVLYPVNHATPLYLYLSFQLVSCAQLAEIKDMPSTGPVHGDLWKGIKKALE